MSQASTLKSSAITNLDSVPVVPVTAGEGAPGYLREIDGFVTTITADTTSSIYKLVRLPSNAKLKSMTLDNAALSTSAAINVGLYYSDAPVGGNTDGTNPSLAGTVVNSQTALFASAQQVATANQGLEIRNQSGNYPISLHNQPLWMAAGLTSDPGGYFDIVAAPSSAITAGGVLGVTVSFCD